MGMDVPGRDTVQSEPAGERGKGAVTGPVPREKRALKLNAQSLDAKRFQQHPDSRDVMHTPLSAAGQAEQTFGVCADRCQCDGRRDGIAQMLTRSRMGDGQQAAQVAPTAFIGNEQREMTPVIEAQLSAVNRAQAESARGEVSWISPIARALLKARVGDEVKLVTPGGLEQVEVLEVRYPAPDLRA